MNERVCILCCNACVQREQVSYYNSKNILNLELEFDNHFSQYVNFNFSSVHIPVEIYDGGTCVCMCVCVCVCARACTSSCVCLCVCACVCVCVCLCVCACVCVCLHVCRCICDGFCVYTCVWRAPISKYFKEVPGTPCYNF